MFTDSSDDEPFDRAQRKKADYVMLTDSSDDEPLDRTQRKKVESVGDGQEKKRQRKENEENTSKKQQVEAPKSFFSLMDNPQTPVRLNKEEKKIDESLQEWKVITRTSEEVQFDLSKIKKGLELCKKSVEKNSKFVVETLLKNISDKIKAKHTNKKVGVEEIQDIIITCLFVQDLVEYGTHYVIYRNERKKIRELIHQQKSKVQLEVNSVIRAYKKLDDAPEDTSAITIYDIFAKLQEKKEQLNLDSPLKANISLAHFIGDYIKKNQDGQSRKVYSFNLNVKDLNDKNALQRVIFLVENETIIHSMIVEEYIDIKLAYIAFLDSHEQRDKSKGPGAAALVRGYVDFLALLCPDWSLHIWVDPSDSSARKTSDKWYLLNQGDDVNLKFRTKKISQEKLKERVYAWYEEVLDKENISRYSYNVEVPDLLSYGLKGNPDKSLKGQDKILNEWKALKSKVQNFRNKFQNEFKNTIVIELSKFSLASKEHFVLHERRNDYFYDKPFDREHFLKFIFTKEEHQKISKNALKFLTKEYCNSFELFDCGEVIDESPDAEEIEKNLKKKKGSTLTDENPKKKK